MYVWDIYGIFMGNLSNIKHIDVITIDIYGLFVDVYVITMDIYGIFMVYNT